MLPWSAELAGRLDEHVITSDLLRGNPLGDPHERPLWVYVPPGYDAEPERRHPSVYVIQGYTGHVAMWRNRAAFRQPFIETADAVFARGDAPPAIVVYVDAWTAYGGSQFVDSPGTGRYHSYLCDEVVPWVDGRYRTLADRAHRAITGKSSGGFGAMITPMLRPDLFGALATTAPRSCRSIRGPACSAPICGSAGLISTRYGWCRGTPTRSARCARSGSMAAPRTNGTSTSGRRPSGRRLPMPESPPTSSISSCSNPGTWPLTTAIRWPSPGFVSAFHHDLIGVPPPFRQRFTKGGEKRPTRVIRGMRRKF